MKAKVFEDKVLSLSERIFPMVARMLGNKENAEDAVQEIMIKLWDRRKKLVNHPNITGFVFLTARNYCLDRLKKKSPEIDPSELHLKILTSDMNHDQVEWKELTTIIESILKELPSQQREVMMMRDIDGFEFAEIAAATNLKLEHTRVLLSRARKQVGIKLKEIYSYE
ncbi:MAG: RNA polymerase sigma factor [Bacteroidota bacterium]